eukprot:CAMPEP_0183766408 /NCGR_PEP_ID=MMETSP0739-20130205/11546_1 /TAXON_ID=385413 /ORGANISM="Thalassiosira miniscula, Strain CCMP1093" /LENGTH=64 /DNA_ID=CAMNT_0026005187 /DNA_START=451 /DNA_END=645 /DNA_ORIENTATION=-
MPAELFRDFERDIFRFGHDGTGIGERFALGLKGVGVGEEAFFAPSHGAVATAAVAVAGFEIGGA